MKYLTHFPLWLLSGLLYGLSWPIFAGINLSFLAWFAFVPLFIFLEKNKESFWKSMMGSYAAMVVFGTCTAGWLFNFPQAKIEIAAIFFLEEFYFFFPFLPFFFLQKKLSFQKAIWLFPLLWVVWEWTYLPLEFTMGTHLSAYSQSSNIWLIQYIDVTGMWGIAFWLMLFNVLIYKAFTQTGASLKNRSFYLKAAKITAAMLLLPLLYGGYAFSKYNNLTAKSATISLIPTQFSAEYMGSPERVNAGIESTLHRTDSLAFVNMDKQQFSDLYVWPETGTSHKMGGSNLSDLLREATNDWKSALLTGSRSISDNPDGFDQRGYMSGVLISSTQQEIFYHHKTVLCPGQETIPYHHWLAKIPSFPIPEFAPGIIKRGEKSIPLPLTTANNQQFKVGVSLCFEQWYPHHWATLARNGADFYVHMAGEGWYGEFGFQQFMANVSRMRCIENRKGVARCANVGLSMFINHLGIRYSQVKKGTLNTSTSTSALKASPIISCYAHYPNWFPIICLLGFIMGLVYLIHSQTAAHKSLDNQQTILILQKRSLSSIKK